MAKAKKRVAARKKGSKRGKPSAKPARKMAAKHATPKKAKSKVRRAGMSATKPVAKKKRPPETAERRQLVEMPVETSISPGGEPQRGEGTGPAGTST
jgi:hypothetical protein